jgi:hypothetical protein
LLFTPKTATFPQSLERFKKLCGHSERGFLGFGIACREAAPLISGKLTCKAWEAHALAREHGRSAL